MFYTRLPRRHGFHWRIDAYLLGMLAVLCVAFGSCLHAAWGAQSAVSVTESGSTKLGTETRTQGVDTVHDEVVVPGFSTYTTKTEFNKTAASSSSALFGSSTPCHSVVLLAPLTNGGPVWVRRQSGASASNSFPVYPGAFHQFAAPSSRDCADVYIIEGSGCSGCVVYGYTN
ncbi:MAG: hypothetical protein AB7I42_22935 [Bradyrhizobium sp.]|uniref:hypothetical protein n=1 Tax=Bradyrhizobium sp. TaxID=376 RepID=UPI003D100EA6